MIESSSGQLTIVDANNGSITFYWRGEKLNDIITSMTINTTNQRKVTLKVTSPEKVIPALTVSEVARLNAIYEAMKLVDITVNKVKVA